MRRIRIAHVVNDIGRAGKELGIIKLLDNLNTEQFECILIIFGGIADRNILNSTNYRYISLNHDGKNDIKLPIKLSYILKKHQIDIVHTHAWGTLIEGIGGAKLASVPIIIHGEHGTFPEGLPYCFLQNLFWHLANRMLSVSAVLGKKISEVTGFPFHKIKIILNGVDESNFYPSQRLRGKFRRAFDFSDQDFIVGTIGRLTHVKNIPMLIRSAAYIVNRGESIRVVVVGGGEMEKEIKSLAHKLNILNIVEFLGVQEDINLILNGIDVFTLTSYSEGCSNVILEAMFAQKAIIATNVGGNTEIVSHGLSGLLVQSDDDIQLANSILRLKKDDLFRKELGTRARQKALRQFSLSTMVENYEQLYLEEYSKKFY